MRRMLFLLCTTFLILACGGTPTPSDADRYMATYEAERDAKDRYFNCTTNIDNQVDLLEKNADTCSNDYDCRAKIAQQMEELADQLKSTCVPVQSDLSPDFNCKVRLIQARANFVHGAPNETGENRTRAEEALANQVRDAYEYCFSLLPEPNP